MFQLFQAKFDKAEQALKKQLAAIMAGAIQGKKKQKNKTLLSITFYQYVTSSPERSQ